MAIGHNVLSRAPAKRLIEMINNTLCIKFGAKASLVKGKEGSKAEGALLWWRSEEHFYLCENFFFSVVIHQSSILLSATILEPSSMKEFSHLLEMPEVNLLSK